MTTMTPAPKHHNLPMVTKLSCGSRIASSIDLGLRRSDVGLLWVQVVEPPKHSAKWRPFFHLDVQPLGDAMNTREINVSVGRLIGVASC